MSSVKRNIRDEGQNSVRQCQSEIYPSFHSYFFILQDDSATRIKSTRINQIRKLHSASTSPKPVMMNGDIEPAPTTKGNHRIIVVRLWHFTQIEARP